MRVARRKINEHLTDPLISGKKFPNRGGKRSLKLWCPAVRGSTVKIHVGLSSKHNKLAFAD